MNLELGSTTTDLILGGENETTDCTDYTDCQRDINLNSFSS